MPTSTAWSRTRSERSAGAAERAAAVVLDAAVEVLADALPAVADAPAVVANAATEAELAAAAVGPADGPRLAVTTLLAEALTWCVVRSETPASDLLERVAACAEMNPVALGLDVAARTFDDPRVSQLPPATAIGALLALVPICGPVAHVSLWRRDETGSVRCVHFAGTGCPSRSVRDAACRSLNGGPNGIRRGLLQVTPVPGREHTVLVARPRRGTHACSAPFLHAAARALQPALGRASALDRDKPIAELLASASERRVTRIGFDLHDGPIQTLAMLIGDTRLVGSQVAEMLDGDPRRPLVGGRLGDLKARMVALEFELRCMCHSLEAPAVLCRPLERVLEHEAVALQRLSGIQAEIVLEGCFDDMTPSQRIALLRVVQEALRNVREHSGAKTVAINIQATRRGTEAVIEDDGGGFDVDEALARAVRDGRVGLIGMMERVRLLGGRCDVRSRKGGPSTVSLLLPAWRAA
jgi:signal transduction histidine kinase